jgi:hypothetical protein
MFLVDVRMTEENWEAVKAKLNRAGLGTVSI